MNHQTKISWPDGKRFAFTIVDDTDRTTIVNGPPIYKFLYECGFRTTKTVWPIKGKEIPLIDGSTCEDPDYREWCQSLQKQGFEIALHNVTYHTSKRAQIIEGIEIFKEYFGGYPSVHVNHSVCLENIYWGDARLGGLNRIAYNFMTRFMNYRKFGGHVETSELFWGDICREKIKYVVNFTFSDMNTLNACPYLPYHDKKRSYVNNWFATSEGPDCESFVETICEKNQDRLEEEGGACIMYTHFGEGFYQNDQLNPRFKDLMQRLSQKSGWFVPISTLLDYIIHKRGRYEISQVERTKLEWKWLFDKLRVGGTS